MGITEPWTEEEQSFLIASYGKISFADLAKGLPQRTEYSIRSRASKLGLHIIEPAHASMPGQRFGKFTLIEHLGIRNGKSYCLCRCDCGKEISISLSNLRAGNQKSCGCIRSISQIDNLTNQRFGKLLVIEFASIAKGSARWKCLCDCGNEKIVRASCLKKGWTRSCGCLKNVSRRESLLGQRFGKLLVIAPAPIHKKGDARWVCKCDCGNETEVPAQALKSGNTRSCGIGRRRKTLQIPRSSQIKIRSDQYMILEKKQKGRCAICGVTQEGCAPLFIDHHHASKLVRGLLCGNCNFIIGFCREDPGILQAAINYLERHALFTGQEVS